MMNLLGFPNPSSVRRPEEPGQGRALRGDGGGRTAVSPPAAVAHRGDGRFEVKEDAVASRSNRPRSGDARTSGMDRPPETAGGNPAGRWGKRDLSGLYGRGDRGGDRT